MTSSCLIIKNDGIGDLIACSGLISGLATQFGGRVDLVTCEQNCEVAERIEGLNRVLYISRDGLRFRRRPQRLGLYWPVVDPPSASAAAALKAKRYDVAICLRRYVRLATFACMKLVRARRKLAYWQFPTNIPPPLADKLNQGWEHWPGDSAILPETTYYRDVLKRSLGVELDGTPRLRLDHSECDYPRPRKIGLCLGGASARWPSASWVELVGLLRSNGWDLTLFGGSDCAELAGTLERNFGCHNRVGKLTLPECAGELAPLAAVISNDTGLAHLASLVSSRTIVILGGGTFGRFLPWPGATNQYVVFHGLECFDCSWTCKFAETQCHQLVRPSAVFRYFRQVIGGQVEPGLFNLNAHPVTYTLSWRCNASGVSVEIPAGRALAAPTCDDGLQPDRNSRDSCTALTKTKRDL
jgi:ADP-heptose:LPS heptosyltransferase